MAFVYVLSNSENKGIVKVGHTTGQVAVRLKQINSGAGVVGRWYVVHEREWIQHAGESCSFYAEQKVHKALAEFHVKKSVGKEHFRCSVEVAKVAVDAVWCSDLNNSKRIAERNQRISMGNAAYQAALIAREKEARQRFLAQERIVRPERILKNLKSIADLEVQKNQFSAYIIKYGWVSDRFLQIIILSIVMPIVIGFSYGRSSEFVIFIFCIIMFGAGLVNFVFPVVDKLNTNIKEINKIDSDINTLKARISSDKKAEELDRANIIAR